MSSECGGLEKEFVHTSFAVRQTIAEKREIAMEARIGMHRKVNIRIESVVDRDTFAGADLSIMPVTGVPPP